MVFDNIKQKAKDALGKHSDKADQGIDKAADAAKSKFGDHSDKIDSAADKAKGFVNEENQSEQGDEQDEEGGKSQ